MLRRILRFIDGVYKWLQPLVISVASITGVCWQYEVSNQFTRDHPVKSALIVWLIGFMLPACIFFTLLSLVLHIANERNRVTISYLEEELTKANDFILDVNRSVESLFDSVLTLIATDLNFNDGGEDRVTLYIHDGGKHFIPCGRFSYHPEYRKKGRLLYPDAEGCISLGWKSGWHFDNDFGLSASSHRSKNVTTYNIKPRSYRQMRMRSNMYAVRTILESDSKTPLAVLVVESIRNDKFVKDDLKKVIDSRQDYLSTLIRELFPYIPNMDRARRLGF